MKAKEIMLRNHVPMPALGMGCYNISGEALRSAVDQAAKIGYRLFDTAKRYGNEKEVGEGLRRCGVPREELFIISKIWPTDYDEPVRWIEAGLKAINCGYLDMMLLHWPGTQESRRLKAWEALLKYRDLGLLHNIGVSNFSPAHLEGIKQQFGEYPVVNEIEHHPWYQQHNLTEFCRRHQIAVIGWRPLCRGRGSQEPLILELAAKYQKTPSQIILRWDFQKGIVPIPKSSHLVRLEENISIFDYALADEEILQMDALECGATTALADPETFDG